jgi:hypothetical protein
MMMESRCFFALIVVLTVPAFNLLSSGSRRSLSLVSGQKLWFSIVCLPGRLTALTSLIGVIITNLHRVWCMKVYAEGFAYSLLHSSCFVYQADGICARRCDTAIILQKAHNPKFVASLLFPDSQLPRMPCGHWSNGNSMLYATLYADIRVLTAFPCSRPSQSGAMRLFCLGEGFPAAPKLLTEAE